MWSDACRATGQNRQNPLVLSPIARTSAQLHGVLNCAAYMVGLSVSGWADVSIARSAMFQYFILVPAPFCIVNTFYADKL